MNIITTVERLEPSTTIGEAVKITYTYSSFNKKVIDELEKEMSRINDVVVVVIEGSDSE